MKDPATRDLFAGVGTALMAATIMFAAIMVPVLLFMIIVQQDAGLIIAESIIAGGLVCAAHHLRGRPRRNTQRVR